MKIVEAHVRPSQLSRVVEALYQLRILPGVTIVHAQGFGRAGPGLQEVRADEHGMLAPHAKVEIHCPSWLEREVVQSIESVARTGSTSDGKITVFTEDYSIQVATGENEPPEASA